MKKNIYEEIKKQAIIHESKIAADNKQEWEKYLKSFLIDYSMKFKNLIKTYNNQISSILNRMNLDNIDHQKLTNKERSFLRSLVFFKSGMDLFEIKNNNFEIIFDNFNKYTVFNKKERNNFEADLNFIEQEYEIDGIVDLEHFLQFVINFEKSVSFRESFFMDYLEKNTNYVKEDYHLLNQSELSHISSRNNYMTLTSRF